MTEIENFENQIMTDIEKLQNQINYVMSENKNMSDRITSMFEYQLSVVENLAHRVEASLKELEAEPEGTADP